MNVVFVLCLVEWNKIVLCKSTYQTMVELVSMQVDQDTGETRAQK